jgi:hypothetical protein
MSFTSTVTALASVEAERVELPGPAWAFGVTAFAFFMVLLGVLWSFRNTSAKYYPPATATKARHTDPHGATDQGAHH